MSSQMSKNKIQYEFNLNGLFSQLFKAKRVVIFIVFICTLFASLFAIQIKPTYESSALIELGSYNSQYNERELIESSKSFMSNFKINLFYKDKLNISENVSVTPIEKSLIKFTVYSDSDKKNLLVLDKILSFTQTRHTNMFDQINNDQINKLSSEIKFIENEIEFIDNRLKENINIKKLDYLNEIDGIDRQIVYLEEMSQLSNQIEINNLNIEIPKIIKQIESLKMIIIEDEANLNLLKSNPKHLIERNMSSPTLNQIIHNYKGLLAFYESEKLIKQYRIKTLQNVIQSPEIFKLQEKKRILENQINLLKKSGLSLEIFELKEKLKGLESEIKFNENRVFENSILTNEIQTFVSRNNSLIIIIFGLILGFFASILYVLISNYLSLGKSKST
jgi:LPS O-antigen subunit length determinant protein (WzzB/FepE family)